MTSVLSGRLLPRPRDRHDGYALCAKDGFWFRPAYTDGKCPLCGDVAPGGGPAPPMFVRIDRFTLGMATVGAVWLAMTAFVLYVYFG